MTATIPITESTILARMISPDEFTLSPAVAAEVLKWTFSADDHKKMADLAAKARAGTMTAEEQALAGSYERIGSLLGVIKSKARRALEAAGQQ